MVDLFYKLKALQDQGILIHLHCFTAGRAPSEELTKYCASVHYYKRERNISGFSLRLPFIVRSRANKELIEKLQQDDHPILLEGIHCTYFLYTGQLANRKVLVRLHNTEFLYYKHLAKHERNPFKRIYFLNESRLLKKYEQAIANKACIICVSEQDVLLYRSLFGAKEIHHLPVFIPWHLAAGKEGTGCFCLYHGNLSVNENEKAAAWLLGNVFNDLDIPFIIAGRNPGRKMERVIKDSQRACLVANPSEKEMQDLIARAHINILPSFNNTGIKLKLLNAMFNGRHCLVNTAGVEGSGLGQACCIANEPGEFKKAIGELYQKPFAQDECEQRQGMLLRQFNNEQNAKLLITWLY